MIMKKIFVGLVILVSVVCFSVLVYYGSKYSRGVPEIDKETEKPLLEVPFLATDFDLSKGIDTSLWESQPALKINLFYQVMVLPWPKKVVPYVMVKAFHNKRDIYFYMEWEDSTKDKIIGIDKFSDACAIMFPLGKNTQPSTLMMGFLGNANIWQWKASQDAEFWLNEKMEPKAYGDFLYPFEEEELFKITKEKITSPVNDLVAVRIGTITPKPEQNVTGRGIYDNGTWKVVFKRTIEGSDREADAQFPAKKRLSAFAVWNGSEGDTGGKKSISDWVELELK